MKASHLKLGLKPRRAGVKRLQMAKFLDVESLPPAPEKVYYEYLVDHYGMLANDSLGDCTAAGVAHSLQLAVAHSSDVLKFTPTDEATIDFYSATTGYNPANPASDMGGDEDQVLSYLAKNGFAGYDLLGYVEIDPQNIEHVKQAIYLFGSVYTGIALPLSAQNQSTWDVTDGTALSWFQKLFGRSGGNTDPGSWGGHCTICPGYGARGLTNVTWGQLLPMTWEFWQKYATSCYALLWKDWTSYPLLSRIGFDTNGLLAAQKELAV